MQFIIETTAREEMVSHIQEKKRIGINSRIADSFPLIILPPKRCCGRVTVVALGTDRLSWSRVFGERRPFGAEGAWTRSTTTSTGSGRGVGRGASFTLGTAHALRARSFMLQYR
jgi:hypothetical protein